MVLSIGDKIAFGVVTTLGVFTSGLYCGTYLNSPVKVYDKVFNGKDYRTVQTVRGGVYLMEQSDVFHYNNNVFLRFEKNTDDIIGRKAKGLIDLKEVENKNIEQEKKKRDSLEEDILNDN